ncbi:hypothetical protein [Ammoniphilus sp. 3BR4]|uniref:hypothetical protein n=1 Tax=Ammoniphilus sp. 3BR4 TaxID=3158265 RepID=UPI0034657CA1
MLVGDRRPNEQKVIVNGVFMGSLGSRPAGRTMPDGWFADHRKLKAKRALNSFNQLVFGDLIVFEDIDGEGRMPLEKKLRELLQEIRGEMFFCMLFSSL